SSGAFGPARRGWRFVCSEARGACESGGGPPHSTTLRVRGGRRHARQRLGVRQSSGAFGPARRGWRFVGSEARGTCESGGGPPHSTTLCVRGGRRHARQRLGVSQSSGAF